MKKVTLKVKGMSCQHCVQSVQGAVAALGAAATVRLEDDTVQVQFDDKRVTLQQLKEAIEDQGYDVVS